MVSPGESLYIDAFVGVAFQVPAWSVAEVGKQGANAALAFGLGKVKFGSAIFFMNRVVGLDGHGGKGVAALRNFVADGEIVSCIRDQRQ